MECVIKKKATWGQGLGAAGGARGLLAAGWLELLLFLLLLFVGFGSFPLMSGFIIFPSLVRRPIPALLP